MNGSQAPAPLAPCRTRSGEPAPPRIRPIVQPRSVNRVVVGLDIACFGQLHCIVHVGAQTCPGAQMPGMHTWRQVGVLGSCGIGVTGIGGGEGGGGGGRTMTCAKDGLAVSTINTNSAMRAITIVLLYELSLGGGIGDARPAARRMLCRIALSALSRGTGEGPRKRWSVLGDRPARRPT